MTILHRIFHHIDAARPLARVRLCLCLLIVGVIVELATAAASHAALVSTSLDQVLQSTGIGIFVVALFVLVGALWLDAMRAARRLAASRLSLATATILSEAILLAPFVPLVSQVQGSSNLEVLTTTIPASMSSGAGMQDFYYHTDDLYNVMAITDDTGAVADAGNERYEYADYGQPVDIFTIDKIAGNPSAIGNPYNFTGRRYDTETGWYYYRTRYLDPIAGRFTTRDTIGIWGDPTNLGNGYAYVGHNPFSGVDPQGELLRVLIIIGIIVIIVVLVTVTVEGEDTAIGHSRDDYFERNPNCLNFGGATWCKNAAQNCTNICAAYHGENHRTNCKVKCKTAQDDCEARTEKKDVCAEDCWFYAEFGDVLPDD